jgi:hypothetical protein
MGAKFWSDYEKEYFINVIVPLSQYATGTHDTLRGRSFADLASKMQADLDKVHQSRRQYTGELLYEHWYQKVRPRHDTPGRKSAKSRSSHHSSDEDDDGESPFEKPAMPIETLLQKFGNTGPYRFRHGLAEETFAPRGALVPKGPNYSVVSTPPRYQA